MRRWSALLVGVFLLTAPAAVGQTEKLVGPELIPPVDPVVINVDLRTLPSPPEWKPGDPIEVRPRVMHPKPPPEPPLPPLDQDPLAGPQPQAVPLDTDFSTPIHNFEGQGFSGVYPADPIGEVGPDYYAQMINGSGGTRTTFYNKVTAVPVVSFLLQNLAPVGSACRTGRGDPIVLYDHLASRWFLSEIANGPNAVCLYISQTSDPISGGWFLYQINTLSFPDYPKYAVWPDAYYMNTNENNLSVYALDRDNMLAGLTLRPTQKFTAPALSFWLFQTLPPIDLDGPPPAGSPAFFVRQRDTELHNTTVPSPTQDFIELWPFKVNWDTPASSTFGPVINISVADFSSLLCDPVTFQCIPQPVGRPLDPLREAVMWKPQYRNFGTHESIVGNFPVALDSPTHAGVRWFELRRVGAGPWTLHQEGTWAGPLGQADPTSRWMAGSGMDKTGNIAVGYDVSSSAVFPGIRYTGRLAADPLGTMSQGDLTLREGTGPSLPTERWGDYNSLNVDTEDDCTFWFTSMYGRKDSPTHNPFGDWFTRIGSFKFADCVNQADLAITKVADKTRAATGRNLTYTLTVTNNGPDPATDVVVTDTLPPTATFVSASPPCTHAAGIVTCNLGTMANGAVATVQIVVRPNPPPGVITNTASVTASTDDPVGGNNSASVNTPTCRITTRPTTLPCN